MKRNTELIEQARELSDLLTLIAGTSQLSFTDTEELRAYRISLEVNCADMVSLIKQNEMSDTGATRANKERAYEALWYTVEYASEFLSALSENYGGVDELIASIDSRSNSPDFITQSDTMKLDTELTELARELSDLLASIAGTSELSFTDLDELRRYRFTLEDNYAEMVSLIKQNEMSDTGAMRAEKKRAYEALWYTVEYASEFLSALSEKYGGVDELIAGIDLRSNSPDFITQSDNDEQEASRSPEIFLCHASEDKESVLEIYECLRKKGATPWIDKKNLLPGQDWDAEIQRQISNSRRLSL